MLVIPPSKLSCLRAFLAEAGKTWATLSQEERQCISAIYTRAIEYCEYGGESLALDYWGYVFTSYLAEAGFSVLEVDCGEEVYTLDHANTSVNSVEEEFGDAVLTLSTPRTPQMADKEEDTEDDDCSVLMVVEGMGAFRFCCSIFFLRTHVMLTVNLVPCTL